MNTSKMLLKVNIATQALKSINLSEIIILHYFLSTQSQVFLFVKIHLHQDIDSTFLLFVKFKPTTSISVFECPILQTMHPFFMRSRCDREMTFLFPVHVMATSMFLMHSSMRTTRYPSILQKHAEQNFRIILFHTTSTMKKKPFLNANA